MFTVVWYRVALPHCKFFKLLSSKGDIGTYINKTFKLKKSICIKN